MGASRNLPSTNNYRPYNPTTPNSPPGLQRHSSDRSSDSTTNSPPVRHFPNNGTFSPPVAIGSGISPSDIGPAQSRHSLPGTYDLPGSDVNNSQPTQIGTSSAAFTRNNSYGSQRFGRIERHLAMARAAENIPPNTGARDETFSSQPYV